MNKKIQNQVWAAKATVVEPGTAEVSKQPHKLEGISSIPTLPRPANLVAYSSTIPGVEGVRMVHGEASHSGFIGKLAIKKETPIGGIEIGSGTDPPLSVKEREEFDKRREDADKQIERVKAKMAGISTGQQEQAKYGPKLRSASKVRMKVPWKRK